jgi:hypothetical protein
MPVKYKVENVGHPMSVNMDCIVVRNPMSVKMEGIVIVTTYVMLVKHMVKNVGNPMSVDMDCIAIVTEINAFILRRVF